MCLNGNGYVCNFRNARNIRMRSGVVRKKLNSIIKNVNRKIGIFTNNFWKKLRTVVQGQGYVIQK